MTATRLVEIRLAALTRVEYTEVLEVPADMTPDELQELVDKRYDDVDGGLYTDDTEYWEQGSCYATPADGHLKVTGLVTRDEDGLTVESVTIPEATTSDQIQPTTTSDVITPWLEKINTAFANMGDLQVVFSLSTNDDLDPESGAVHEANNGQKATIIGVGVDPNKEKDWDESAMPFFRVRFADGKEAEVYEEELFSNDPRFFALSAAVVGGYASSRQQGFSGPFHLADEGEANHKAEFLSGIETYTITECAQTAWTPVEFRTPKALDDTPAP